MKPETALFLEKSRDLLEQARTMLGVGLNEAAGRTAYLAGFHAAQALIFETTVRVFKNTPPCKASLGGWSRTMRDLTSGCGHFCRAPTILRPSPITKPAPIHMCRLTALARRCRRQAALFRRSRGSWGQMAARWQPQFLRLSRSFISPRVPVESPKPDSVKPRSALENK